MAPELRATRHCCCACYQFRAPPANDNHNNGRMAFSSVLLCSVLVVLFPHFWSHSFIGCAHEAVKLKLDRNESIMKTKDD